MASARIAVGGAATRQARIGVADRVQKIQGLERNKVTTYEGLRTGAVRNIPFIDLNHGLSISAHERARDIPFKLHIPEIE